MRVGWIGERMTTSTFVRQVGALWTAQGIVAAVTVVQGVLVARWLGPTSFGVAALIVAVPSLVFTFMDARASEAAVRYLGEFQEQGDAARARAFCKLGMGLDVAAASATLVIVAATAPWAAAHVVHEPSVTGLLVVYGAAMVLRAPASTSEAVLVTLTEFRRLAILQTCLAVLRNGLVLVLVGTGHGIAGAVWGAAIGMTVEGAVMVIAASRAGRRAWDGTWWSSRLGLLRSRAREITHFVVWSDAGSLLGVMAKQLDVIMVGAFAGSAQAGFYRLARSLGSLGGFVVGPVQSVLYQRFSKLRGAGDREGLAEATRRAVLWVSAPLALAGLVTLPFVPYVVVHLAGPEYRPAVGVSVVMVLLSITWFAFLWVRPLVLTLGEVRLWALTGLGVAIGSLAGFLLLIPPFQAIGAAWVRYATSLGAQLIPAWVVWRRYARGGYRMPAPVARDRVPAEASVGGTR
jgi:O-antigen/teichoic acid export membrane protein